jgi:uncharacterized protein
MRVTELCVYPVKGAAGIPLHEARLDAFGIEHDRRWMIVGGDGTFITQRNHAGLALLGTALEPDALVLRSRLAGEARVPLRPVEGVPVRVTVWHDEVDAMDAGDVAAAFLEAHLGFPARLVHMPESTHRQAPLSHARAGDRVSFADAFPLLLITQESLDELDHRLRRPIPMARFRPNVVVAGAAPHAEDSWRRIRIGTLECDVVKPCARCVVPTIDPATATPGREPLRTLAGYRKWDGHVWFGQNLIHRDTGVLRTGETVTVLETGPARPPIERPPGLSAGIAAGSPPTA